MNAGRFLWTVLKYVAEVEPGSVVNTVTAKQPAIWGDEIIVDFEVNPVIRSIEDFVKTVDALLNNRIGIAGIIGPARTNEAKTHNIENDFWMLKQLIKAQPFIQYEDLGLAVKLRRPTQELTLVGVYKKYVKLEGIKGKIAVTSIMPDEGFEKYMAQAETFEDIIDYARDFNAIVVGANPYTVVDPKGLGGIIKFRLATAEERGIISERVFPEVDAVSLIATNCAWMMRSDELVKSHYSGSILANSGMHTGKICAEYTRAEAGRSGNVFVKKEYNDGEELRDYLFRTITRRQFRHYHNHTPIGQFIFSIAL